MKRLTDLSSEDVKKILGRVVARVIKLCRSKGLLSEEGEILPQVKQDSLFEDHDILAAVMDASIRQKLALGERKGRRLSVSCEAMRTRWANQAHQKKMTLLVSYRTGEDLICWNDLVKLNAQEGITVITTLSRETTDGFWHGRIDEPMLAKAIDGQYLDTTYMTCGPIPKLPLDSFAQKEPLFFPTSPNSFEHLSADWLANTTDLALNLLLRLRVWVMYQK